jgi:hypothetical protein
VPRTTLDPEAIHRRQHFDASMCPVTVTVRNDDAQRTAAYQVARRTGDSLRVEEVSLEAGRSLRHEFGAEGGDISNTGRAPIEVSWD